MPGAVAVLDANVLVPIVACDFLLTAFDRHLIEPIVSSIALDEVQSALIEDFPHLDPDALRHRVARMRAALEDQTVDTMKVEGIPETINAKDRHVVAAALGAEAPIVVSNDGVLRSEIIASGLGLEPLDADTFVMRLWEASPAGVDQVVGTLINKRRRRPVSPSEMAEQLRSHFPSMSAAWLVSRGL